MVPLTTLQWIRGFLSEPTGAASNSRLIASVSNVAALILVFLVTLKGTDIPSGAQVILLCAMGVGTLGYLGNKVMAGTVAIKSQSTTGEPQ